MIKELPNRLLGLVGLRQNRLGAAGSSQKVYSLDRAEVAAIHKILEEYVEEEEDDKWSDLSHLKEYLFDKRLYFFQDLLDKCERQRVTFAGQSVADVGTGTGCLLRFLHARAPTAQLTGYGWQEPLLRLGRRLCPSADFLVDAILRRIRWRLGKTSR